MRVLGLLTHADCGKGRRENGGAWGGGTEGHRGPRGVNKSGALSTGAQGAQPPNC